MRSYGRGHDHRFDTGFPRETLSQQLATELGKLRLKKYRDGQRRFLVEGERLVADALDANALDADALDTDALDTDARIALAVVDAGRLDRYAPLVARIEEAGIPVFTASEKIFEKISDTQQPQGIAVVAEMPELDVRHALAAVPPRIPATVLWGVADPGNFGTVIRTADWFGSRGVLFSSGSADPFNPKTVRSSMGSLFRVALGEITDVDQLLALARESGRELVATTAEDGIPLGEWKSGEGELLLFGSEAHGLPPELLDHIPRRIRIPGSGAESLNLAVSHGILLHSLVNIK
jgi:RNA methyltransferase, TrmH family